MKLITKTGYLADQFGIQKSVDFIIEAGFDGLDFSFPDDTYQTYPTDKSFYTELRKYVEDKGKYFSQAHAPAPSSYKDEAMAEKMFQDIVSTIKRASYLGVKNIVVHPCQHLTYVEPGVPEQLFEYNMKFFRRLIPYCEEYGIRAAVENMWQYPGMISHSTCSKPEEFVRYIDTIHSDSIVACLDTGHALLVREMPGDCIRALGKKRLQCLHVHDVDGIDDSHTLPYFGITDWDKVMGALAEIDYEGDLTYEADCFLMNKPHGLIPAYLKVMEQTGRHLIDIFEHAKKKNNRMI